MSVLIVEELDPPPSLVGVLCFTLRREGHDVIAAHDGVAGLQLWKAKEPRLVLLDVSLPKMDGWEVCKRIRAEVNVPVIMLTGQGAENDVVHGLELGADDYITKPVGPRQLVLRIQAVLRRAKESADEPRKGWQVIIAGDHKA
ncbi:MAG: response regulator [Dehalococcoidia bacterium]